MTGGARTRRARVLVVDNQDSFTFMLVDLLRVAGAKVTVQRSDRTAIADALGPDHDAVLISPGPGHPRDAGPSVALALACARAERPLLGVCLGHQAIAQAFGTPVDRFPPVHGKTSAVRHDGTGLFAGLPSPLTATRYHSLGFRAVDPPLVANAWSDDGLVMGLRHAAAPIHGVQFHPESIASEQGSALIEAFVGAVESRLDAQVGVS